jgi:Cu+-exporting ATPase
MTIDSIPVVISPRTVMLKFSTERQQTMEKDPVCGMDVNPAQAAGQSEYQGRTYYFCSPGCKRAFDKEPQKYVGKEHGNQGSHGSHA